MKKLCIVGTGSQARYIIENVKNNNNYSIGGLVDLENEKNVGKKRNGFFIKCLLENILDFFPPDKFKVIVAYGKNKIKKKLTESLISMNYKFATIINPTSYISSHVKIGKGCIINSGSIIMPNTKISDHVIIHSGCVIEHDNIIENFVNIAPGVTTAGNVTISEGSYIYTGTCIIPKIHIGKWAVVGAGSVVIKEVKENSTVAGNPAKPIMSLL